MQMGGIRNGKTTMETEELLFIVLAQEITGVTRRPERLAVISQSG